MESIGKITTGQQLKWHRQHRRMDDLASNPTGWPAVDKVHKSARGYTRKTKHKGRDH
jgi:hypothetical protein